MNAPRLIVALAGAVLGGGIALVAFAPASWLAARVADASGQQVLLADASGTVWNGEAQLVLSGGHASRDATALPGRLRWQLGFRGTALELHAALPCCLHPQFKLLALPRIGGFTWQVPPQSEWLAQWPASWLAGLGAPWNTLQPTGTVRLLSNHGITLQDTGGRLAFSGAAELQLDNISSVLAPLPALGSYRLLVSAQANAGESAKLNLVTLQGPLRLSGEGQWGVGGAVPGLRFRGQAFADPGAEAALANLLNVIGRRQGAISVLTIG